MFLLVSPARLLFARQTMMKNLVFAIDEKQINEQKQFDEPNVNIYWWIYLETDGAVLSFDYIALLIG